MGRPFAGQHRADGGFLDRAVRSQPIRPQHSVERTAQPLDRCPRPLIALVGLDQDCTCLPQLEEALSGTFTTHHAIVSRQVIEHIDFIEQSIATLSAEIASRLVPYDATLTIICSITGVGRTAAEVMIAEMGADMSRFPTAGHLCAWAGVAPASHESAGKRRPYGTRHGSTWLQRALIEAARAAARTKGSYFSAQYSRIARRRGPNKAAIAVAHSILNTTWHLSISGALYDDPGADYFVLRHDPAVEAKRLQKRIESLGFEVTIASAAA